MPPKCSGCIAPSEEGHLTGAALRDSLDSQAGVQRKGSSKAPRGFGLIEAREATAENARQGGEDSPEERVDLRIRWSDPHSIEEEKEDARHGDARSGELSAGRAEVDRHPDGEMPDVSPLTDSITETGLHLAVRAQDSAAKILSQEPESVRVRSVGLADLADLFQACRNDLERTQGDVIGSLVIEVGDCNADISAGMMGGDIPDRLKSLRQPADVRARGGRHVGLFD